MDIGLYYYNARYYAPYLNRFISADTIVPDPQNPQTYNRYSYVNNRPVNLTDPTGYCAENGDEACWSLAEQLDRQYGTGLEYFGKLDYRQLSDANTAAVLAFTLSQLDLVNDGQATDVAAMMAILEYSIETVAGGSVETGLMYASSVFWRHELSDILIPGYNYREINPSGPFFDNSGFDSPFSDTTGNQVTHFISEAYLTAAITAYPAHPLFSIFIDSPVGHGIALAQEVRQWIDPNDAGGWFRNDNFDTDLRVGGEAAIFVSSLRTAYTPERRTTVYQETLDRLMGPAK